MSDVDVTNKPATAQPAPLELVKTMAPFASMIDIFNVPDHENINAGLMEAIGAWRAVDPGETTSNQIGWHSSRTLFARREPAFRILQTYIRNSATFVIRRFWPEFDPKRHRTTIAGWVNVNGPGAFNVPHAHGRNHISGCYYVSIPEGDEGRSGILEFLTPMGALTATGAFGERMLKNKARINPRPGQLVLFPAYLNHWVYPNLENEERVSIAFNVRVMEGELDQAQKEAKVIGDSPRPPK